MNKFGTVPRTSTVNRCTDALARSQYPKIDDALELMDCDDESRELVSRRPSPRLVRLPVPDNNHDVHFALDYDNG